MKSIIIIALLLVSAGVFSADIPSCPDDLTLTEGEDPKYPISESFRAIEGWVLIAGKLNRDGTLENINVVESEPSGLFDKSALKAARTWKFSWSGSSCKYRKKVTYKLEN